MESWDDENFEHKVVAPVPVVANKWEGEDEDDEVKESWEDDDEEQQQQLQLQQQQQQQQQKLEDVDVIQKIKKKTLAEKLAEKERLKREEHERRLKEQQEEEISAEEQLRRQKESDLKVALETTFDGSNSSGTTSAIDSMCPNTKEEFQEFADAINNKMQTLAKSTEYPNFAEDLIRNVCATLSSLDLKKIKTTIDNLYLEKQKIEKGEKAKKNKGKGKAKLKLDNENQYSAYVDDLDDFDDFM